MIILRPYETKLLLPVREIEWREPSLAQPKDQFGRQNRTTFTIELWRRDGGCEARFVFEDRDEFDAALYRHLIEEPNPWLVPLWFATTTITSPTGSNQTYSVPSDFDPANNSIECIGGGASGGIIRVNSGLVVGVGGGGGGYGIYTNLALTPGGSTTYQIAALVLGVTRSTVGNTPGNAGNSTWFDGTTYAGASVGATGGINGTGAAANTNGGAGGTGKGTGNFSGGRGGNYTGGGSIRVGTGGGGAAGRNGAGGNGVDLASSAANAGTAGGTGDNGTGGAGSATGAPSADAGDGTEMNGIGAGGGSGGAQSSSTARSGAGGDYGGGTGGAATVPSSVTSGPAGQGAIWITYTPITFKGYIPFRKPLRFFRRAA